MTRLEVCVKHELAWPIPSAEATYHFGTDCHEEPIEVTLRAAPSEEGEQ